MIFLAVCSFPAPRDRCEACGKPGAALLFTLGPAHWVEHQSSRHRERYAGGPDVFVLCREHAEAARQIIARTGNDVELTAHAQRSGTASASWGMLARTAKQTETAKG